MSENTPPFSALRICIVQLYIILIPFNFNNVKNSFNTEIK